MSFRKIAFGLLSAFALALSAFAEKANVFFIHGANVSERDARAWAADEANAVVDPSAFATNTVFDPYPESIMDPNASRLETDFHLAQGIPALSPPAGRTDLWHKRIPSFDMNAPEFRANTWPRADEGRLGGRFLHSDIKNVAYFFVHPVFQKIVEVGGLSQ